MSFTLGEEADIFIFREFGFYITALSFLSDLEEIHAPATLF